MTLLRDYSTALTVASDEWNSPTFRMYPTEGFGKFACGSYGGGPRIDIFELFFPEWDEWHFLPASQYPIGILAALHRSASVHWPVTAAPFLGVIF